MGDSGSSFAVVEDCGSLSGSERSMRSCSGSEYGEIEFSSVEGICNRAMAPVRSMRSSSVLKFEEKKSSFGEAIGE